MSGGSAFEQLFLWELDDIETAAGAALSELPKGKATAALMWAFKRREDGCADLEFEGFYRSVTAGQAKAWGEANGVADDAPDPTDGPNRPTPD